MPQQGVARRLGEKQVAAAPLCAAHAEHDRGRELTASAMCFGGRAAVPLGQRRSQQAVLNAVITCLQRIPRQVMMSTWTRPPAGANRHTCQPCQGASVS